MKFVRGPADKAELLIMTISSFSVFIQVFLKPNFTTSPVIPPIEILSAVCRALSCSKKMPAIMLERVVCRPKEIAKPMIPDNVKDVISVVKPSIWKIQTNDITTHKAVMTSLIFRMAGLDILALRAPLTITLITNSPTKKDTPTAIISLRIVSIIGFAMKTEFTAIAEKRFGLTKTAKRGLCKKECVSN